MIKILIRPEELTKEHLRGMVRAEVVPIYIHMLFNDTHPDQIARINQLIINRWSVSGLVYIKEQAWKVYDPDGSKIQKWAHLKKEGYESIRFAVSHR